MRAVSVVEQLLVESRRRATSASGGITTPSSSSVVESAGMLPGVLAADVGVVRAASRRTRPAAPPTNSGETTVMSGRCVPPR